MTTTATWATVASPSLPQGSLPTARQSPRCLGRAPSLSWFSRSVSRLQRLQPWRRRYRAAPHRHLRTISGRRLRSTLITSADGLSSVCRTPPRAEPHAYCRGRILPWRDLPRRLLPEAPSGAPTAVRIGCHREPGARDSTPTRDAGRVLASGRHGHGTDPGRTGSARPSTPASTMKALTALTLIPLLNPHTTIMVLAGGCER